MSTINEAEFWQQHERFLNEPLVTELPNSITHDLSTLCKTDMSGAYATFLSVELSAINQLHQYIDDIKKLQDSIQTALQNKHKVFLLGCGASGRLAVLLRRICELKTPHLTGQIIAVNSAGDTSLIKSVEQFEDKKEFGIKQLLDLGYSDDDLVIGLSASGESPFILSAVQYSTLYSPNNPPWLIHNNPAASLIKRNQTHILNHLAIKAIALDVGPMALTGSTRLQATTAMLIAMGLAFDPQINIKAWLIQTSSYLTNYPFNTLVPITILESEIFAKNEYILYQSNDSILGLSLLADITERSPTFNLTAFENTTHLTRPYSPFYLSLINQADNHNAWHYLLGQNPVCLNWQDFPQTSNEYIYGFEISNQSNRQQYLDKPQHECKWLIEGDTLNISLNNKHQSLPLTHDVVLNSLIYKIALNMHSTLMLGRLDYFMGNLMISLKPSNFKLIDRAIRYCLFILESKYSIKPSYKNVADILFQELPALQANESIVLKVIAQFII